MNTFCRVTTKSSRNHTTPSSFLGEDIVKLRNGNIKLKIDNCKMVKIRKYLHVWQRMVNKKIYVVSQDSDFLSTIFLCQILKFKLNLFVRV